jgi:hypothetical protein
VYLNAELAGLALEARLYTVCTPLLFFDRSTFLCQLDMTTSLKVLTNPYEVSQFPLSPDIKSCQLFVTVQ